MTGVLINKKELWISTMNYRNEKDQGIIVVNSYLRNIIY